MLSLSPLPRHVEWQPLKRPCLPTISTERFNYRSVHQHHPLASAPIACTIRVMRDAFYFRRQSHLSFSLLFTLSCCFLVSRFYLAGVIILLKRFRARKRGWRSCNYRAKLYEWTINRRLYKLLVWGARRSCVNSLSRGSLLLITLSAWIYIEYIHERCECVAPLFVLRISEIRSTRLYYREKLTYEKYFFLYVEIAYR